MQLWLFKGKKKVVFFTWCHSCQGHEGLLKWLVSSLDRQTVTSKGATWFLDPALWLPLSWKHESGNQLPFCPTQVMGDKRIPVGPILLPLWKTFNILGSSRTVTLGEYAHRVSTHKTISYNYSMKAEILFLAKRSELRWGRENITEQEPESTNVSSFVWLRKWTKHPADKSRSRRGSWWWIRHTLRRYWRDLKVGLRPSKRMK